MIVAEDPTFWSNNGIDPQGILRSVVEYVSAGGKIESGGSTITQQVIKNLSGQNQEDLNRKLQSESENKRGHCRGVWACTPSSTVSSLVLGRTLYFSKFQTLKT